MIGLLIEEYIPYLNSLKPHLPAFDATGVVLKYTIISDVEFDIMDKKKTIKQPLGTGSATYHNPDSKEIMFIDYEDYLNQLPVDLKRCDFVVYEMNGTSFFFFNELSLSNSGKVKMSDARKQLHKALFHFSNVPEIVSFMNKYDRKECILSNTTEIISSPEDVAVAFEKVKEYLPLPIEHSFQPITKLGFKLIETALIEV